MATYRSPINNTITSTLNPNNTSLYQSARSFTTTTLELGALATGVYSISKVLKTTSSRLSKVPSLIKNNGWVLPEKGGGAVIHGRWYTEHALERMAPRTPQVMANLEARFIERSKLASKKLSPQEFRKWHTLNAPNPRGVPPTVIELEIAYPGSTGVNVILNKNKYVITVIPGGR